MSRGIVEEAYKICFDNRRELNPDPIMQAITIIALGMLSTAFASV